MIITFSETISSALNQTTEYFASLGYSLQEVENSKYFKQWNCIDSESTKTSAQILVTKEKNGSIEIEIKFDKNDRHLHRQFEPERLRIAKDNQIFMKFPPAYRRFFDIHQKHLWMLRMLITNFDVKKTGWVFMISSEEYLN